MNQHFFAEHLTAEEAAMAGEDLPLRSDIESLGRVAEARAVEAVVFYAGRILEMVANRAMVNLEMREHGSVLGSLMVLEQFSLMPLSTRYCAHALRRLANDARHVLRTLGEGDADMARALNDVWLRWYFCGFAFGPRVREKSQAEGSVHEVLRACENKDMPSLMRMLEERVMESSPAMMSVAAEAFLSWDELKAAEVIIDRGLERFSEDRRLQMLHGLHLSRAGHLDKAIELMEPLYKQFRNDGEAAGILAGAYKRMGRREKAESWLQKAHKIYHTGWQLSKGDNCYLGVNAATTALLLGDVPQSERIASDVREEMRRRIARLRCKIEDPIGTMEFWDAVTIAELELLLGNVTDARQIYEKTFTKHAGSSGNIEIARGQARMIVDRKGLVGFDG